MSKYILALDQGTTSSRSIVFSSDGRMLSVAQKEFRQIFPRDGWVEHDANEIWSTQLETAKKAIENCGLSPSDISAIGITNQRETTVVWDKGTGKPIYNAIVWQCRRSAEYCDKLKEEGYSEMIRAKTGLLIDAYFSATKIKWILDNVPHAREKAARGELLFGTIDTWLIYCLTGGKVHATDYSNAARTMLFNINSLEWDNELLQLFDIPEEMLPSPLPSSGLFGNADKDILGAEIPITGVAGDQQAALFGQCCFNPGEAKNTYGTGGFMLMNTGTTPVYSKNGLLTTIAWGLDGKVNYVLEGSVFVCGAAIQWLRDGLGMIQKASDTEEIARSVSDSGGVYAVPAFVGLGAPYWDAYARGTIVGISRGTTKAHLVRAVLESMAYQTYDVLKIMEQELGTSMKALKVDGGACANNLLLEFQADILGITITRPACIETTALGAAFLAAYAIGCYSSLNEIAATNKIDRNFEPEMSLNDRNERLEGWHEAVKRSLGWAK